MGSPKQQQPKPSPRRTRSQDAIEKKLLEEREKATQKDTTTSKDPEDDAVKKTTEINVATDQSTPEVKEATEDKKTLEETTTKKATMATTSEGEISDTDGDDGQGEFKEVRRRDKKAPRNSNRRPDFIFRITPHRCDLRRISTGEIEEGLRNYINSIIDIRRNRDSLTISCTTTRKNEETAKRTEHQRRIWVRSLGVFIEQVPDRRKHQVGLIFTGNSRETEQSIADNMRRTRTSVSRVEAFKKHRYGGAFKLFFPGDFPEAVDIGGRIIGVRRFIDDPGCRTCGSMQHTTTTCQKRERCYGCGQEGHKKDDCQETRKCQDCDGPHSTGARVCGFTKAKMEETLKKREELAAAMPPPTNIWEQRRTRFEQEQRQRQRSVNQVISNPLLPQVNSLPRHPQVTQVISNPLLPQEQSFPRHPQVSLIHRNPESTTKTVDTEMDRLRRENAALKREVEVMKRQTEELHAMKKQNAELKKEVEELRKEMYTMKKETDEVCLHQYGVIQGAYDNIGHINRTTEDNRTRIEKLEKSRSSTVHEIIDHLTTVMNKQYQKHFVLLEKKILEKEPTEKKRRTNKTCEVSTSDSDSG